MTLRISSVFSVILLASGLPAFSWAAPGPSERKAPPVATSQKSDEKLQEIQITLFGQPCTMSGPFPRSSLSLLHEISPEKIPPDLSLEQMKRIRMKTGELKGMPMAIEQYRDHLRKRLSAKIAFEEALAPAKKARPTDSRKELETFLKNVKEHISSLQYPSFEEATKKALEANGGLWSDLFISTLRERYENAIQPDTEEEFHKAIRIVKIQYICAFDDSDHHSADGEE